MRQLSSLPLLLSALALPRDIDVDQLLLTLVQLVGEGLLEELIVLQHRVYLNQAEDDRFAHIGIGIAHQITENVSHLEQVLDKH